MKVQHQQRASPVCEELRHAPSLHSKAYRACVLLEQQAQGQEQGAVPLAHSDGSV